MHLFVQLWATEASDEFHCSADALKFARKVFVELRQSCWNCESDVHEESFADGCGTMVAAPDGVIVLVTVPDAGRVVKTVV